MGGGGGKPIVNWRRDIVLRMRTHAYSIAIHGHSGEAYTVAIVMTTYRRGIVANQALVYGPSWVRRVDLDTAVSAAVKELERREHQDQMERADQ